MKKTLVIFAASILLPQICFCQTTIVFKTAFGGNPVDQFVYKNEDNELIKLDRNFFGQRWVGPTGGTRSAIGSPVRFTYFGGAEDPSAVGAIDAGPVQVTTTGNSFVADVQLYAWDAALATYAAAQTAGAFHAISAIMTGALGGNAASGPPVPAPDLPSLGFQAFFFPLPEPSTVTFGFIGLAGLFAARHRRRN